MGAGRLDFREARMPPGVTEVNILAVMGNVEILVPPELAVETHGFGLMGHFEGLDQAGGDTDPDAPRLVI
jgi:predicted membrane protein